MNDPLERISIGVVIERRKVVNKWADHIDSVIDIIPHAPPISGWRFLVAGDDWERYHAATLDIELYPDQAEGYRTNISAAIPKLFVVLRRDEAESLHDFYVYRVTACPYEAEKFMDVGDDVVETVEMPPWIVAVVENFADCHYIERKFEKRKRKPYDPRKSFGAESASKGKKQ